VGNGVSGADLVAAAGENFVVHDPNPPTKVGFRVAELCPEGARLIAGNQKTEAVGQANLALGRGQHAYEVRCLDKPDAVAAQGIVRVLQDSGTQTLPAFAPTANVTTDGRRYTVMYQHLLPKVTVSWPTAPAASSYTLSIGGRTITTKSPSYTFRSLSAGTHQVTFAAATNPPRKSRTTTVQVSYDVQAPAARVSTPAGGFESGAPVEIAGQALPGWSVSVAGKELEVDPQQRFSTEVTGDKAVPITFSHPTHGTHYYLRRPKAQGE
jgi:hypothetical protein